ncbi:uncharacterized protein LOC116168500 isoform X3 [Photinus pyralis]|nr:uncharacterized protein LOC116168500 isoform X3 [Photinus pyralis]XP_031340242.1 uncharacterized protein LOC116168500 isoform X3 [Photinus pyralis]
MIVRKCCFCCSLKYGVYTWSIIQLILRFVLVSILYFLLKTAVETGRGETVTADVVFVAGSAIGLLIGTILVLIVALKGIVEKRHILIYPYIVVLIAEIVIVLGMLVYLSIKMSPLHMFEFLFVLVVNGYTALCVISLYRVIKQEQKSRQVEAVPINAV